MATIKPFKAVRPTRAIVGLVAARPYDSYTVEEQEARMDYNPYTFLHIVNPGYKYDQVITGEKRYELVKNRYLEFKEDGVFIQDTKPSFYVYKIVNREKQVFNGYVAATSTEDYKNNIIKKHEDTLSKREELFKNYLKTVGFNAEPVLLTYPDHPELEQIIKDTQKKHAEFEFTMTYRDTHYLWKISDEKIIKKIENLYQKMSALYIADGHHRSASSYLLAESEKSKNPKHNGDESYNFFMSYLIPESNLIIHEFNRFVKDLNGLSKDDFLIKLDKIYRIENRGTSLYKPSKPHHFSMYLDGDYYALYLMKDNYKFETSLDELDAQLLYKTILQPILGIDDLRDNNRLDYFHGRRDELALKTKVDSGKYALGFGMCPATVSQMKNIADEGLTMPPKSTYILPKLRSGITIYEY